MKKNILHKTLKLFGISFLVLFLLTGCESDLMNKSEVVDLDSIGIIESTGSVSGTGNTNNSGDFNKSGNMLITSNKIKKKDVIISSGNLCIIDPIYTESQKVPYNNKDVQNFYKKYVLNKFSSKKFICNKQSGKYIDNIIFGKDLDISSTRGETNANDFKDNIFTVVGDVYGNPVSMYVQAINEDLNINDFYKLKSYKNGDAKRKYNISPDFGNIQKFVNLYIIIAEYDDGSLYVTYFTKSVKNIQFTKKHTDKYCILDICSNKTVPTKLKNGIYSQNFVDEKDTKINIEYKIGEYITLKRNSIFSETTTIKKLGDYYIKQYLSAGCGGYNIFQEIYDLDGKLLKNIDLKDIISYSDNIVFGNIDFKASVVFKSHNSFLEKTPTKINNLLSTIKGKKNPNGLSAYWSIATDFNLKIDGIWVNYRMQDLDGGFTYTTSTHGTPSDYLITMNSDKSNSENKQYNIINTNYTKKILNSFSGTASQIIDKDGNIVNVNKLKSNWLPIFARYPIDNKFELLLTTRGHKYNFLAEMCKPAIYVYDQQNRDQNITVDIVKNGFFTHLDPDLNINNGRNYKTNNSKVEVDGKAFDYLYYAVKVPNYVFNTGGWIVSGNQAVAFFEHILPQIGFNQKEQTDFIEYWETKFKSDKIYFISWKYNEQIEPRVKLNPSIKPDSINRVIMEALEFESGILEPTSRDLDNSFFQKLNRGGELDIFERGGIFMDTNGEMFIY